MTQELGQTIALDGRFIGLLLDHKDGLGPSRLLLTRIWEEEFPEGYRCAIPTRVHALVVTAALAPEDEQRLEELIAELRVAGSEPFLEHSFSPKDLCAA